MTKGKVHKAAVRSEHVFQRFNLSQRLEHLVLFLSIAVLLITGLPQKYQLASWSQAILATPDQVTLVRKIHLVAAVILILEALFHLGMAIAHMAKRKLSADMFITGKDFRDAAQMIAHLLFLRKEKPAFGKYNFEQKVTYWFMFFGIGIMIFSGLILQFPLAASSFLPGSVIPGARLAHSSEAVVLGIFIVLWHFYHVHLERLNLSIFSGHVNEEEMKQYHSKEYERLTRQKPNKSGGPRS